MNVSDNLRIIQDKIERACSRSDRNPADIKIVAVTKYVSTERAEEAVKAGIINLGENRDEGLLEKYTVLKDVPQWHFIGSLQTRKVKSIIDIVEYIHSLDRLSLAKEIQKRAKRTVKCLVQVNVSGEESKHGMEPEETLGFIESLKPLDHISVVGLMTMAPLTEDEAAIRTSFRKLKELQLSIQKAQLDHAPCTELSMGMSNDYQIAIEEGATFIRIGTALVGDDS